MNPKITLSESNLNKEIIASNIIQHDFITNMVAKSKKKPRKIPLNTTSPFGDFPKSYYRKTKKITTKENKKPKKSNKPKKIDLFFCSNKSFVSDFRNYYTRGDIPIRVLHSGSLNKIKWNIEPDKIDLKKYLPLFVDGLKEKTDPYRFLAILGSFELIESNSLEKIIECLPLIIMPMKRVLNTKDFDVIAVMCKFIQKLLNDHPEAGKELVPYYRQLLPVFNLLKNRNKNLGDKIEYNQRKGLNIGDLVNQTLELMEVTGGEDAFINIKYMIPTYESYVYS